MNFTSSILLCPYLGINLCIFCYMNIWTYKTSKERTGYLLVNKNILYHEYAWVSWVMGIMMYGWHMLHLVYVQRKARACVVMLRNGARVMQRRWIVEWSHYFCFPCAQKVFSYTLKNAGLKQPNLATQRWVNIGQNTCCVISWKLLKDAVTDSITCP